MAASFEEFRRQASPGDALGFSTRLCPLWAAMSETDPKVLLRGYRVQIPSLHA